MNRNQVKRLLLASVLALEDAVEGGIALGAQIAGRRHPMIVPFIGHGTPTRARIGARLVLARREAETVEPVARIPRPPRTTRTASSRALPSPAQVSMVLVGVTTASRARYLRPAAGRSRESLRQPADGPASI